MKGISKKIYDNLKIINKDVEELEKENPQLINFIIEETLDRVYLYLNVEKLPQRLERVLANIVNNGLNKAVKTYNEGLDKDDRVISSMSDNGQSVSYSNEIQRLYSTQSDEDLFTGFTPILNRYRRINV